MDFKDNLVMEFISVTRENSRGDLVTFKVYASFSSSDSGYMCVPTFTFKIESNSEANKFKSISRLSYVEATSFYFRAAETEKELTYHTLDGKFAIEITPDTKGIVISCGNVGATLEKIFINKNEYKALLFNLKTVIDNLPLYTMNYALLKELKNISQNSKCYATETTKLFDTVNNTMYNLNAKQCEVSSESTPIVEETLQKNSEPDPMVDFQRGVNQMISESISLDIFNNYADFKKFFEKIIESEVDILDMFNNELMMKETHFFSSGKMLMQYNGLVNDLKNYYSTVIEKPESEHKQKTMFLIDTREEQECSFEVKMITLWLLKYRNENPKHIAKMDILFAPFCFSYLPRMSADFILKMKTENLITETESVMLTKIRSYAGKKQSEYATHLPEMKKLLSGNSEASSEN